MASRWPVVSVSDIAERTAAGPFGSSISSKHFVDAGVPVIRGSNLSQDIGTRLIDNALVFLREEKAAEFSRSEARKGDLIFTCWGTIDQVGLIDDRAMYDRYIVSNKQMLLTPRSSIADSLFLYYYFSSPMVRAEIVNQGIGSSVPGFNLGQLRALKVSLPPLAEQKDITRILGTLDDKIELNRRMNVTMEAVARALFQSWFVDFDPVHAKAAGRHPFGMDAPTAALFPASFQDSAHGKHPLGWRYCEAQSIAQIGIGKTPPRKEPQWFSESHHDIPWVSIKDMGNTGIFAQQTSEFLTEEAVSRFNVRRVTRNTVLLSFKLTVGRVVIADMPLTTNEAIAHFGIYPKSGISHEFLYLYLSQFDYGSLGSTSSIATAVNSATIRAMPILIPPKELVAAFSKVISPLFEKVRINQSECQSLSKTRDLLLPRLLSGKINISSTI